MTDRVEIQDGGDGNTKIIVDGVEIPDLVAYHVSRRAGELHVITFELLCRTAIITDTLAKG